jgi:cell division protein FtsW (lipid II flippase)
VSSDQRKPVCMATSIAVGVACGLGAAFLDYRKLRQFHLTWFLLRLAVLLLVAVLIPGLGVRLNGARRWLPFGGQPLEMGKLGLIVWLSS